MRKWISFCSITKILQANNNMLLSRTNHAVLLAVCLAAAATSAAAAAAAEVCPPFVWRDEFLNDGPIDGNAWSFQEGDGCHLGEDLCGWGNNERQFYRKQNANVTNGRLWITAELGSAGYSSARIRTKDKVSVDFTKPRRVEAAILTAKGKGIWPAFWMMPADLSELLWPSGGEVDIMEVKEPDKVHGYLHYGNKWNDKATVGGPLYVPVPPDVRFHVYAVEKHKDRIDFFVDNYLYQSYSKNDLSRGKFTWPFDRPFYMLLNVAVGGNWAGDPDATSTFPTTMQVDYVRVYDISGGSFGKITGPNLVFRNSEEIYCLESNSVEYTTLKWIVPAGATAVESNDMMCAAVAFGTASGYVEVVATSSSCGQRRFSVPVKVQAFYEKEFSFVTQGRGNDKAAFDELARTGVLAELASYDGKAAVEYKRNGGELYDNFQLTTSAIPDASEYVNDERRFFMDVHPTTSAKCTEVLLQLEATGKVGDWPFGRHSRYRALLQNDGDGWERLEFSYVDSPDDNTGDRDVDRIVILFNPEVWRADTYYFANLDSTVARTKQSPLSEPLSTSRCRVRSKSEEGACTDGANNDGFGFDGEPDGPVDCDDADCYFDPVCVAARAPECLPRRSRCEEGGECCGKKSICKKRNIRVKRGRCVGCRKKGQKCLTAADCCKKKAVCRQKPNMSIKTCSK